MTTPRPLQVVLSGGGTGGHLFAGLAVAAALRAESPGTRIALAGSGRPFERVHAAAAGLDYVSFPCRPAPQRLAGWPGFVWSNLAGFFLARSFLRRRRASVVVGLGGYPSAPAARAAVSLGIPLVLLEQNASPGRVTRWLAPRAAAVCLAFDESRKHFSRGCKALVTGNPVRPEFFATGGRVPRTAHLLQRAPRSAAVSAAWCGQDARAPSSGIETDDSSEDLLPGEPPRAGQLLVLGGSAGARSLNEAVPRALRRLGRVLDVWTILHQSGESGREAAGRAYAEAGVRAAVVPFIADVPGALGASGFVVSRAGGTTLAELAAAGRPALLVPYPHAADDHQRRNAEVFVHAGAAAMLDERECGARLAERLAGALGLLLADGGLRAAMARSIRALARPDAARSVVEVVRRAAALAERAFSRRACSP